MTISTSKSFKTTSGVTTVATDFANEKIAWITFPSGKRFGVHLRDARSIANALYEVANEANDCPVDMLA